MKTPNLLFASSFLALSVLCVVYGYQELIFLTKKPNDAPIELIAVNTLKASIDHAGLSESISIQRPPGLSSYGCERWSLDALRSECGTVFVQSKEKLTDLQVSKLVADLQANCGDSRQSASERQESKRNAACGNSSSSSSMIAIVFRTYSTTIEQDGSRRNKFSIYQIFKLRM